jgi:hypothetical protein
MLIAMHIKPVYKKEFTMITSVQKKANKSARLVLVASQNNEIQEGDMQGQIVDLLRNLKHLADEYNEDVSECLINANELYKTDIENGLV